jgi:hypothetical protein
LCHPVTQRCVVRMSSCPKGRPGGREAVARPPNRQACSPPGQRHDARRKETRDRRTERYRARHPKGHGAWILLSCRITSVNSQEIGRVLCYKTAEKYRQPQTMGKIFPKEGSLSFPNQESRIDNGE